MKTLIIYKSIHHGNTEKIAKAIAETLNATLKKPSEVRHSDIKDYDLIGFGSGIYFSKHHKRILELVRKLPDNMKKKAFIFSTHGVSRKAGRKCHKALLQLLRNKGFKVIGEFNCRGYDSYGPLKLIGGISKNHPDRQDLEDAKRFAEELAKDYI